MKSREKEKKSPDRPELHLDGLLQNVLIRKQSISDNNNGIQLAQET